MPYCEKIEEPNSPRDRLQSPHTDTHASRGLPRLLARGFSRGGTGHDVKKTSRVWCFFWRFTLQTPHNPIWTRQLTHHWVTGEDVRVCTKNHDLDLVLHLRVPVPQQCLMTVMSCAQYFPGQACSRVNSRTSCSYFAGSSLKRFTKSGSTGWSKFGCASRLHTERATVLSVNTGAHWF